MAAIPDAPDPMASLKRGLGNGKRKRLGDPTAKAKLRKRPTSWRRSVVAKVSSLCAALPCAVTQVGRGWGGVGRGQWLLSFRSRTSSSIGTIESGKRPCLATDPTVCCREGKTRGESGGDMGRRAYQPWRRPNGLAGPCHPRPLQR